MLFVFAHPHDESKSPPPEITKMTRKSALQRVTPPAFLKKVFTLQRIARAAKPRVTTRV
jgi:hypothetical protein